MIQLEVSNINKTDNLDKQTQISHSSGTSSDCGLTVMRCIQDRLGSMLPVRDSQPYQPPSLPSCMRSSASHQVNSAVLLALLLCLSRLCFSDFIIGLQLPVVSISCKKSIRIIINTSLP